MDIQNLRDSRKLQSILSAYPGELKLVCGHIHRNITTLLGSVFYQIAPGTSHAVNIDLRVDAPNCLTKEPGEFLLHDLRDGIFSHSTPIGHFDGPHLFYPKKVNPSFYKAEKIAKHSLARLASQGKYRHHHYGAKT